MVFKEFYPFYSKFRFSLVPAWLAAKYRTVDIYNSSRATLGKCASIQPIRNDDEAAPEDQLVIVIVMDWLLQFSTQYILGRSSYELATCISINSSEFFKHHAVQKHHKMKAFSVYYRI